MSVNNAINYIHARGDNQEYRDGFVATYKQVFGGPPYNEVYTDEQVRRDVWLPHVQNGIIILAVYAGRIIGFGCGLFFECAPEEIRSYLISAKNFGVVIPDFSDTWYPSELGVMDNCRRRGIGTQLIGHVLAGILLRGNHYYMMRTAAEGSNSRHIFESIGSGLIPGVQDVSKSNQVTVNKSQSTERVYLYGHCAHGLAKIFLRQ